MLKEKLESGSRVFGTLCRIVKNPAIAYLVRNSGLDFIMYDAEHSDYDMETLHDLFLTGRALGISSLVRVPVLTKDWVSRALDQGADGIMVPMVETPEQAEELVHWSRYQPVGERGYGSCIPMCDFQGGSVRNIMDQNNRSVLVIAEIESAQGVENAYEIAGTEGIDAILVGPNDLSCSYGFPGDSMNEIEINGIRRVIKACREHGKVFALPGPFQMVEMFKEDTNMVMLSTDTNILTAGMKKILEDCEKIGIR